MGFSKDSPCAGVSNGVDCVDVSSYSAGVTPHSRYPQNAIPTVPSVAITVAYKMSAASI